MEKAGESYNWTTSVGALDRGYWFLVVVVDVPSFNVWWLMAVISEFRHVLGARSFRLHSSWWRAFPRCTSRVVGNS